MEYYKQALNKYAVFEGRSSRAEFWHFTLMNIALFLVLGFIGKFLGFIGSAISMVASLALLVPSLSVTARRLHDTNITGWVTLVGFIPIIGLLILLFLTVQKGDEGGNKYGPAVA